MITPNCASKSEAFAYGPVVALACVLLPELISVITKFEVNYSLSAVIGMVAMMMLKMQGNHLKKPKIHQTIDGIRIHGKEHPWRRSPRASALSLRSTELDAMPEKKTKAEASMESRLCGSLEEQVSQFLPELEPTAKCHQVVQDLSTLVQGSVDAIIPGAKVTVFLKGPFWRNAPFVTSIPEIEVIVSASTDQLATFSLSRGAPRAPPPESQCEFLKWCLRVMVKPMLKDDKNYRWRRSGYVLPEAKVVLLANRLGGPDQLVAFDLSLNALQPVHNELLLVEAGKFHPSIRGLLLFVRRWSKVRGISQAGQGYLSSYAWTLMVIYFLQVSHEPLLPQMHGSQDAQGQPTVVFEGGVGAKSLQGVVALFDGFVHFYKDFDWLHEEICITSGQRSMSCEVAAEKPRIRDPFRAGSCDLVALLTTAGMDRVKQEIHLATTLLETEASLNVLMQQWIPCRSEAVDDSA